MKRRLGMAVMLLALVGCGGDGDRLEPAAFDLTGRWGYEDIACTSTGSDLPQVTLAELDGQLEHEASQHPGLRVVQTGGALDITYLDDGERKDATVSGDEIEYFVSEQRHVNGWVLDWNSHVTGTVLDADTIAVTEETELAFRVDGTTGTVRTVCAGRLERSLEG